MKIMFIDNRDDVLEQWDVAKAFLGEEYTLAPFERFSNVKRTMDLVRTCCPDVVVVGYDLGKYHGQGAGVYLALQEINPQVRFVLNTGGYASIRNVRNAGRSGQELAEILSRGKPETVTEWHSSYTDTMKETHLAEDALCFALRQIDSDERHGDSPAVSYAFIEQLYMRFVRAGEACKTQEEYDDWVHSASHFADSRHGCYAKREHLLKEVFRVAFTRLGEFREPWNQCLGRLRSDFCMHALPHQQQQKKDWFLLE